MDRRVQPKRTFKIRTRFGSARNWRSRKNRPCDTCRRRKTACVIELEPPCRVSFTFIPSGARTVAISSSVLTNSQADFAAPEGSPVDLQKMRVHLNCLRKRRDDLLVHQVEHPRGKQRKLHTVQKLRNRS